MSPGGRMDRMTPGELLAVFADMAFVANHVNRSAGPVAPAKGGRGLKRRAKKARRTALERRLQRISWCAYGEALKREAT